MKFAIAAATVLIGAVVGCAVLAAESTKPQPVGERATIEESANCLVHDLNALGGGDWRLHATGRRVDECFPRQTAATGKP
jgi:hypothetical protein